MVSYAETQHHDILKAYLQSYKNVLLIVLHIEAMKRLQCICDLILLRLP